MLIRNKDDIEFGMNSHVFWDTLYFNTSYTTRPSVLLRKSFIEYHCESWNLFLWRVTWYYGSQALYFGNHIYRRERGGEWVWDLENLIYTIMRRNNLQFARNMFAKYNLIKRKF